MNHHKSIHAPFLHQLCADLAQLVASNFIDFNGISLLNLTPHQWSIAIKIAANLKYRFVGIWAQELTNEFKLHACLELSGSYLLLCTTIEINNPKIASFTPYFPGANRLERHTHDMFGIVFVDHPDQRRWTRHQAWSEHQFPLRKNFPAAPLTNNKTLPDNQYPFLQATGSGVYEIPVGPVHAGIIEPGHFRFQVAGEEIIHLEEHLGYVHKGIEKIAETRHPQELLKLAGRVSGDSTVAHAWAAAAACESAVHLEVPLRAIYLRALMCERERIANHLGDCAAICNDVAYTFPYFQLTRLKEIWLRLNKDIFAHRLMMDNIIVGGVTKDITHEQATLIRQQVNDLTCELSELHPIFEANPWSHDRFKTTGFLSAQKALQLGALGYVGRASQHAFDMRHHAPYPPYDQLKIQVPCFSSGDVLARVRVRAQEILIACEIILQLLAKLPDGNISATWSKPVTTVSGIGLIEGWRGEILTFVSINSGGLVERYFPRDPSWFSWPALEQLIHGNIVPDFPVCNKSINGSYSGVDL